MSENKNPDEMDDFRPRGTIVILVIFVLTLIALWASVYMILLSRGVTV
jgi:hypothetical protein